MMRLSPRNAYIGADRPFPSDVNRIAPREHISHSDAFAPGMDRAVTSTAAFTLAQRAVIIRDLAGPRGGVATQGEYLLHCTKAVRFLATGDAITFDARLNADNEAGKRIETDIVHPVTFVVVLMGDPSLLSACVGCLARAFGENGEGKP